MLRIIRLRDVVVGLSVAALLAVAPSTASAATEVFEYTGGEQAFTVPEGVSSIKVEAIGGRGGAGGGGGGGAGGAGAKLTTVLEVTPGQTLYVEVGGNGSTPGGGFNGGGNGGIDMLAGGGGGGASDLRTVSRDDVGSLASRLAVAAGGGGGGGGGLMPDVCSSPGGGGAGGGAGEDGQSAGGGGGEAGTATEGGEGGESENGVGTGVPGSLGAGGDGQAGGWCGGGAGGGGYYGGGGGGTAGGAIAGGGGGGGGSSYSSGTDTVIAADTTGVPRITITYVVIPTCEGLDIGTGFERPVEISLACTGGGPLSFALTSGPAHGGISRFDPDAGTLIYRPDAGYSGSDSFSYRASGPDGGSVVASMTVEIGAPPMLPPEPPSCSTVRIKGVGLRVVKGPRGAEVRVRLRASEPAQVKLAAELRFRRKGKARSVSLGERTPTLTPAKRLRLRLPARVVSRGLGVRRARIVLGLRARPVEPAGCEFQGRSRVRVPLPIGT